MISIKKHLEEPADLVCSIASAYQAALLAMSRATARTAPGLAPALNGTLPALDGKLAVKTVTEIDRKVVAQLDDWGERASGYFRQKTTEVKEILLLVTRSAQAAGEKDARYVSELGAFSTKLSSIANLEDLTDIRKSLTQSASELKSCVQHLAEDSSKIVDQLRSEVASYEARLAASERQASLDPLTGVENRRGIERSLEDRMARRAPFCLVFFDLNEFKQINDVHGHLAGDEILKQFASELRCRFRPVDTIGRWGGDEFVVIFNGSLEQAESATRKASEWLFGEYRIKPAKVMIKASIGLAEWNGSENAAALLKRADENMYKNKNTRVLMA